MGRGGSVTQQKVIKPHFVCQQEEREIKRQTDIETERKEDDDSIVI
jgi:hypothetical protein